MYNAAPSCIGNDLRPQQPPCPTLSTDVKIKNVDPSHNPLQPWRVRQDGGAPISSGIVNLPRCLQPSPPCTRASEVLQSTFDTDGAKRTGPQWHESCFQIVHFGDAYILNSVHGKAWRCKALAHKREIASMHSQIANVTHSSQVANGSHSSWRV